MEDRINLDCSLSRAHWCGNFSCSDAELLRAVQATRSTDVGLVGLYLATCHEREVVKAPRRKSGVASE
jgi:hypothetical protein